MPHGGGIKPVKGLQIKHIWHVKKQPQQPHLEPRNFNSLSNAVSITRQFSAHVQCWNSRSIKLPESGGIIRSRVGKFPSHANSLFAMVNTCSTPPSHFPVPRTRNAERRSETGYSNINACSHHMHSRISMKRGDITTNPGLRSCESNDITSSNRCRRLTST